MTTVICVSHNTWLEHNYTYYIFKLVSLEKNVFKSKWNTKYENWPKTCYEELGKYIVEILLRKEKKLRHGFLNCLIT